MIKFIVGKLGKKKHLLLTVAVVTVFYTGLNLFNNLFLSFIIDNVIDAKEANGIFALIMDIFGGRLYLRNNLYIIAIIMIILYVIANYLLHLRQKWQALLCESLVYNIKLDLFSHIAHLPHRYFISHQSGELIQKCTSDTDMIRRFFSGQYAELMFIFTTILVTLSVMFSLNVKLASVAATLTPIIIIYSYFFFKRIQKEFLKSDIKEAELSDMAQESIGGIRVVKAFNRERYMFERFKTKNKEYADVTYKMILELGKYWSSSYFVCIISQILVALVGMYLLYQGELSLGNYIVFLTYEAMLVFPLRALGRILSDFGKVTVSIKRIMDIFKEEEEDLDSGLKPSISEDIHFNHLCFSYDNKYPIFDDLTYCLKANTTLAIIGKTGVGKTTLANLLLRLYDAKDGMIKIGDVNINDINKTYLRSKIGIVSQETFLYSRTILDNLKMVKEGLKDEEVYEACKIANIHDDICALENGYQTIVGERGVTLSGGQKQRLSIARTLLKDNDLIIFDDSLSAVDTKTDTSIRNNLNKLKDVTKIIITQRINTAKDADEIIVLDKGRVAALGKHEDLIKQEGLYSRLYNLQMQLSEEYYE